MKKEFEFEFIFEKDGKKGLVVYTGERLRDAYAKFLKDYPKGEYLVAETHWNFKRIDEDNLQLSWKLLHEYRRAKGDEK